MIFNALHLIDINTVANFEMIHYVLCFYDEELLQRLNWVSQIFYRFSLYHLTLLTVDKPNEHDIIMDSVLLEYKCYDV